MTYVAIEKPSGMFGRRGEVVCYLTTLGGKRSVDVEWKDQLNILVSTQDQLGPFDLYESPKESCGNIQIAYSIPGHPAPEEISISSESVPEMIRLAVDELAPCLDEYSQRGGELKRVSDDIRGMQRQGLDSLAIRTMINYSNLAGCEMSKATRARLIHLSGVYKLNPPTE
jgi:hypothetical protein